MTALPVADTPSKPFTFPEPSLKVVETDTPFEHEFFHKMGVGRRFFDIVVLKGTFTLAPGKLQIAPKQTPVTMADEPWDVANAERSSLRRFGDVLLFKPTTDVIVTGTAHAPGGEPLRSWEAAVEVRRGGLAVVTSRARVLGPRRWRHADSQGWSLTEPEPVAEVPIRYELAYGGAYPIKTEGGPPWAVYRPNPSGTGFVDESTLDTALEYPAPQWESITEPVGKPNQDCPLVGFGPVARPWSSRLPFAGTYDEAWLLKSRQERARGLPSDYAADFDPRFFQYAHPELITPEYLTGSEEIVLTGLARGQSPLSVALPGIELEAWVFDGAKQGSGRTPVLDTVHVDLDTMTVSVSWRLTLPCEQGIARALFRVKKEVV
jgi:hypothetical protein